jgi:polyketide biosynthesis acyl carrier protein
MEKSLNAVSSNAAISRDEIFAIVLRHVRHVLPDLDSIEIGMHDSLRDLGANSIDRADILMDVMQTLSLSIQRIELLGPRNLGELVELIHGKLQQQE